MTKRDYGADTVIYIRPLLAPQHEPGWIATYQQGSEPVHLFHVSRN